MKFLIVVLVLAVAIFFVTRALQRGSLKAPQRPKRRPKPPVTRTIAPDDDPDFLRDLDRKRRRDRADEPDGLADGRGEEPEVPKD